MLSVGNVLPVKGIRVIAIGVTAIGVIAIPLSGETCLTLGITAKRYVLA